MIVIISKALLCIFLNTLIWGFAKQRLHIGTQIDGADVYISIFATLDWHYNTCDFVTE